MGGGAGAGEGPGRFGRPLLWGLLVAVLLALAVAGLMAPRWAAESRSPAPAVYGAVPDFELVNRDGETVRLADLAGGPWVADFIFTRCGATCPRLTARMRALGARSGLAIRKVSFSVDPEHDTPEVLAAYAAGFGVADDGWLFLTGEREAVRRLVVDGFRLGIEAAPPGADPREPILHSTRFVLVDGAGRIRGYYEALGAGGLERLESDLLALGQG